MADCKPTDNDRQKYSLCYFVGYTETELQEADLKYVDELTHHFDRVIVLTNRQPSQDSDFEYRLFDNIGYDFGFLYQALLDEDLTDCRMLGFVNNSNVLVKDGTLGGFFDWCNCEPSLFCGLTDSYQVPSGVKKNRAYHIQSHLLIFKDVAIDLLKSFFTEIDFEKILSIKDKKKLRRTVIRRCEIGLTQYMIMNGLRPASWFSAEDFSVKYGMRLRKINLHSIYWEKLINAGYPLIKKKIVQGLWDDFLPNRENVDKYI